MYDADYPSTSQESLPDVKLEDVDIKPVKLHKKLPKNQCPSTCLVCRNPAVGYHYDIPSCNGCKTFFRRTILSGLELKCSRDSDCFDGWFPVDMSRRTCRSCRFEKCIQVGMNPLAISCGEVPEGARKLMEEIMEKRASRGFVASTGIVTQEDKINKIISKLSIVETKIDRVHTDGIPDGFDDMRSLKEVLISKPMFCNKDIPNLVKRIDHNRPKTMDYAHSSFLAALEYSKTFEFSKKLNLEDKLILARHVTALCSNMMNAFFTISNYQSDRLMLPDGTIAGKNMPEFTKFYNAKPDIIQRTLQIIMRNKVDRVEYMLLKAIVMCNPAVSCLSERSQSILDSERQSYAFCLLKYCRLQHGAAGGATRYAELLAMVPGMEYEVNRQKSFHAYIKTIYHTAQFKELLPVPVILTNVFDEVLDS